MCQEVWCKCWILERKFVTIERKFGPGDHVVGLEGGDSPGTASGWSLGRWPGWPGSSEGPGEGSSPTAVGDPLVGLAVCWWCATEG